MLNAKCDICGDAVAPALNKAALARNMGLHKRNKHNIQGKHFHRNQKLKIGAAIPVSPRGLPDSMLTPSQLARRQYQRDWALRKAQKAVEASPIPPGQMNEDMNEAPAKRQYKRKPQEQEVVPCRLSECPNCGSRFYMARGGE